MKGRLFIIVISLFAVALQYFYTWLSFQTSLSNPISLRKEKSLTHSHSSKKLLHISLWSKLAFMKFSATWFRITGLDCEWHSSEFVIATDDIIEAAEFNDLFDLDIFNSIFWSLEDETPVPLTRPKIAERALILVTGFSSFEGAADLALFCVNCFSLTPVLSNEDFRTCAAWKDDNPTM